MNPYRLRAYIYLILVAAIWGAAGAVIKFTLNELTPLVFLTYRFFITSIFLIPISIATREKLPKKMNDLLLLILVSLFGSSINLGLLFYGIKFTTVLDQTLISATSPILVVAACAFFLGDKITKKEKIGIGITILGSLVVTVMPLLENNLLARANLFGNLLVFASNIAWVVYIILSKKALRIQISPNLMTTCCFLVGFISLLPFAIMESGSIANLVSNVSTISFQAQLGVIYMALISGGLAYFLFQVGQKSIEASEASLFSYLQPVFAAPLAVLWLKETVNLPFILGAIIIALGVLIAEYKNKPKLTHSSNH
jgi:drug/metabolite transporter (DMT)-like permease